MKCIASCIFFLASAASVVQAQSHLMPLGDSITQGGQGHASYRYDLWFQLVSGGFTLDFVGSRDFTNDGQPNLSWYPEYFPSFDRDHEAYWGWRTDQVAAIVTDAAIAAQPDMVLIHLGTNDIGQSGAPGVANADANLRLIIERLRAVRPEVAVLLAQAIPIGPGTSYFANADQVGPLNQAIAGIAAELDTPTSRVVLVDQFSGFDLATMMQSDGLHPNRAGETWMADVWRAALEPLLSTNLSPTVEIINPLDGQQFTVPVTLDVEAVAADLDGSVHVVEFYVGNTLLGVDTAAPYRLPWHLLRAGAQRVTAIARDQQGASRSSAPVAIVVMPNGTPTSIAIVNPSFEAPVLADGQLAAGPGTIAGWEFAATSQTYSGIFNPPAGSYPTAAGNGAPTGADGANAAYLFNNGGPSESVVARQSSGESLMSDHEYVLAVAIGRFLPDQPYAFSTYGGYRIELAAGGTVIASESTVIDPRYGEFREAIATVDSALLAPSLIGQPLTMQLTLEGVTAPRSTHFDNVRLTRFAYERAGGFSSAASLRIRNAGGGALTLDWESSCAAGDLDYAIYEGELGNFTSHLPINCTTNGATNATVIPAGADRYYLVVPKSATREGSYGQDGTGAERAPSSRACLPSASSCP